jgi:hypothetical protein
MSSVEKQMVSEAGDEVVKLSEQPLRPILIPDVPMSQSLQPSSDVELWAGIKEAEPYSLPPTSSYGHHGRKLRNKLGWTRSNKDSPFSRLSLRRWFVLLYTHLNHGVVRVVGHVLRSIDIVDAYTVSERFFHVRRIGLVAVSDRFLRSCNVNCVAVVVVLSIVHA